MIVSVPTMSLPAFPNNVSAAPALASGTNFDLNAASASVAYVMQMPSTRTIDRVWFRVNAATTGCTATVRLETVNTADGLPTSTLVHANASQTVTITSGAADYEVTFPGTFSISQGDLFAFVIQATSGTPSAVRFANFLDDNHGNGLPYALDLGAHVGTLAPCFGIGISGSAVPMRHMWPINAAALETYNNTSSPDFRGNKITINARVRCVGLRVWVDLDAGARAMLFAADGATELAAVTLHTSVPPDTGAWTQECFFSSSVTLEPGTYYVAVEATSGTNIGLGVITFPAATWRDGSPFGGADVVYSGATNTPTGTGSWTDTTTKQSMISLLIDGVDDGAGGQTAHVFAA